MRTLSVDEEFRLIELSQSDSPLRDAALTRLFEAGTAMIRSRVNQTYERTPNDVLKEDLEAAAKVGYLLAIQHFNRSKARGGRLATYARLWIQNQLAEEIRRTRWSVGIPERTYKLLGSIMTCVGKLTSELQRSPTDAEIAADLKIDVQEVRRVLSWAQRDALSLEAPRGDKGDICLADLLVGFSELDGAETADVVANEVEFSLFLERIHQCVDGLPPPLKTVLQLRFGLEVFAFGEQRTRREVAAEIGVSEERARPLELAAFERLKHMPEFRRIGLEYANGKSRANS